jgi:hypothetical protein
MNPKQDQLAGSLPVQSNTTSPALTGQPQSVTGGVGTGQIPPQKGGAALAPASPQGSADVGAPLSNGAPSQRAGAGADLDLVKDRGKPAEYWETNLKETGSAKAMNLMATAASNASGKTGQQADMNPEEVRLAGVKMNDVMGVTNDPAQQDKVVEELIYAPMEKQIKAEVDTGVIPADEGQLRMAKTYAQVEGIENEEELNEIVLRVRQRTSGPGTKDSDSDGKKDGWVKRFKGWWQLGKDDPSTPNIREDQTVEVTRFMGGMTRQELSMFVFQWGSLMMVNADQGFGGAMGAAGLGAMEGHQGRTTAAAETEKSDAQQKIENQMAERRTAAQEKTAGMAGQAQGFTNPDGMWVVPKYDPETGQITWNVATDDDGNKIEGDPTAGRDYNGEKVFLDGFLTEAGWTKKQIADLYGGAGGPQKRRQDLTDALMSRISSAGIIDVDPITSKKYKEFKEADIKKWVDRMLSIEEGPDPALPSNDDGAALPPNKPASDYLNTAQTE